jgi:hypothetical protein
MLTVGEGAESEPLERVQFVRDEMANMVWAIEEVIPDATGAGIDGYDAADRTGVLPEPIADSPAAIRYLFGTTVPEISSAGVSVTRAYQRVRWYDGRTFVWIGRSRETGRGAGASSLRFDQIEPTEGAGAGE